VVSQGAGGTIHRIDTLVDSVGRDFARVRYLRYSVKEDIA
jgi:hypothetical protein